MKWLIASDLHGRQDCCRMLLERFEEEKADRLLLLGDLLAHGFPDRQKGPDAAEQLNAYRDRILWVRGNCDTEADREALYFLLLGDSAPIYENGILIFATHGHLWGEYRLPPLEEADVLLAGHTHVPALRDHGGWVYMNPGSVGLPRGGSPNSYMTMENGLFSWKTLQGETVRTFEMAARRAGR